jgi:tripartite-type tricarboxylate transporter receptor subunit TctC
VPILLTLVGGFFLPGPSVASKVYPAQPVNVIVAFTPGATTGLVTRMVSTCLSEQLGETFVVESKPGVGGNIGTEFVV